MRKALLAIAAFVTDPPGWIPAWALTATFLWLCWRAQQSPEALAAAQLAADVLKVTLATWLGYKGWRALPDLVAAWKGRQAGGEPSDGDRP